MALTFVPLLQIQRDLLAIPRGPGRFEAYIRAMLNDRRDDVRFAPLVAMNPMARQPVADRLDGWIALDAEGIAARLVADASADSRFAMGEDLQVGLVVIDDQGGGWTNRAVAEHVGRFEVVDSRRRGWVGVGLWSSQVPDPRTLREAVLTALHRAAYLRDRGPARTLREKMVQEGTVHDAAGCETPALDAEDLAYSRDVIAPFLEATDMRTAVECLFGDEAARSLGFTPRGLSPEAGLAVALDDARASRSAGHALRPPLEAGASTA